MSALALLIFPLVMAFAASTDLLTMRISNKLVLFLVASFFALAFVIGMPLQQIGLHVLCAAVVLVVFFGFFAMRWIGGGDAKLAAATALWLGFSLTLPYMVYTAVFGGVLTLMILGLRSMPLFPAIARYEWLSRLHNPKQGVPYGIAMAFAGLVTYSNSAIFERLVG